MSPKTNKLLQRREKSRKAIELSSFRNPNRKKNSISDEIVLNIKNLKNEPAKVRINPNNANSFIIFT